MKKLCLTLMIALLATFALALAGCSGSGSSGQAAVDSATLVGTWQLTSEDGVSSSEQKRNDEDGFATFLILQEDGTALYEYLGDYFKGSYQETGDGTAKIDLKRARLDEAMKLENGTLSLQRTNGTALEFKKIDDSEREAYDEKLGYDPHVLTGGDTGLIVNDLDTVLVDDEYCKITALNATETPDTAGFDLEVVNKTDSRLDVRLVADSATAGGEKLTASNFYVEMTAGATETGYLSFYTPDLGGGLEKLEGLKFQLEAIKLPEVETVATYDLAL